MNSYGRIFRISILGESHGDIVGVCIDGCPAGLNLEVEDFLPDLERRQGGNLRGTTPRRESDIPIFKTGIFNNKTTGAPILIEFTNTNTRSTDYKETKAIPRPGHADFTAEAKYGGFQDYRGGGHFSGRLTVGIVAAGVIAKKILNPIDIQARIVEIGGESNIDIGLQRAIDHKDSIGGIVECMVKNVPIGIGEHFFDSVESVISHIVFAIPAVKGIEFGSGFSASKMFGSEHNDCYQDEQGKTNTNHSGGIIGGITSGNDIIFRIAVKPTSSTPKPQQSFNFEKGQIEEFSIKGRHDLCIALRVPVILEAVTAIALLDLMMIGQKIPFIYKKKSCD